jgi:flavin-dependent dehydrogenase
VILTAQALVIGGGVAGGAIAAQLACAGRDVILIERKAGAHDKVCGEFVSGEAVRYLRGLGIDLLALGAVPILTVNINTPRRRVGCDLPFPAVSISRRALDEAILSRASICGTAVRRGRGVKLLRRRADRWVAELDGGSKVVAADVFLTTGKHDLREWKRSSGHQNDLIAFKLHWRPAVGQITALGPCVELFLFPGGYAGIEPVENGILNLCLVVRRSRFAQLGGSWEALFSNLRTNFIRLHQLLAGGEACWSRPLAIASIPYGFVQRRGDGTWRLGDQAAVIPSFTGDGIAIALHSAQMAANYYLSGKPARNFQSDLASDVTGQVRRATLLSRILVRSSGQVCAAALAGLAPGSMRHTASLTRIPSAHVRSALNARPGCVTGATHRAQSQASDASTAGEKRGEGDQRHQAPSVVDGPHEGNFFDW